MEREARIEDGKVLAAALAIVAFCVLLTFATGAFAKPVLRTSSGPVTITLYDDKRVCQQATNLPRKAVWMEAGKEIHGCWGLNPFGMVMFWFEDRTVASAPGHEFVEIKEVEV
jgi:hypothetical protein